MKNLINSTWQVIKDKTSRGEFNEYVELAIDASTDSEVIKTIPMVNTLTGGGKFIISIRDQFFLKKMKTFLNGLEDIEQTIIDEFIEEIRRKNQSEKLGEKIVSMVEQADSKRKSRLLGILFRMFLKKELSKDNFELLTFCTNKTYIQDLYMLYHFGENQNGIDDRLGSALLGCGLVNIEVDQVDRLFPMAPREQKNSGTLHNFYTINKWGKMLRPAVKKLIDLQASETE